MNRKRKRSSILDRLYPATATVDDFLVSYCSSYAADLHGTSALHQFRAWARNVILCSRHLELPAKTCPLPAIQHFEQIIDYVFGVHDACLASPESLSLEQRLQRKVLLDSRNWWYVFDLVGRDLFFHIVGSYHIFSRCRKRFTKIIDVAVVPRRQISRKRQRIRKRLMSKPRCEISQNANVIISLQNPLVLLPPPSNLTGHQTASGISSDSVCNRKKKKGRRHSKAKRNANKRARNAQLEATISRPLSNILPSIDQIQRDCFISPAAFWHRRQLESFSPTHALRTCNGDISKILKDVLRLRSCEEVLVAEHLLPGLAAVLKHLYGKFRRMFFLGLVERFLRIDNSAEECPTGAVLKFCRLAVYKMVPSEFLGPYNLKIFLRKWVKRVVRLRCHRKIWAFDVLREMDLNACAWLPCFPTNGKSLKLGVFALCVAWLFDLVSTILKSFFYATEVQTRPKTRRLSFYRKSVWKGLTDKATRDYIASCKMQRLKLEEIAQLKSSAATFGPFRLRFIPKNGGNLRPIIAGKIRASEQHGKSKVSTLTKMNRELKYVVAALRCAVESKPQALGCGVTSVSGAREKWARFIALKQPGFRGTVTATKTQTSVNQSGTQAKPRDYARKSHVMISQEKSPGSRVFVVKLDAHRCFDTIEFELLRESLRFLRNLFPASVEFCVQRFRQTTITQRSGKVCRKMKCVAWTENAGDDKACAKLTLDYRLRNYAGIIEPCGELRRFTWDDIDAIIEKAVFTNILTFKGGWYHQRVGISQGNALSTMLCNLYYGGMERALILGSIKEGLLLRYVDDYLLVTPNRDEAVRFVCQFLAGVKQYNVRAKPSKVEIDFEDEALDAAWPGIIHRSRDDSDSSIRWLGCDFSYAKPSETPREGK